MSSAAAAPRAAVSLSPARAEASRRNGAKSRGPKTPEGKARSAQNALKHGLRAQKHVVLPGESAAEFAALEAALMEELAPEGALQCVLAQRVVAATWRLARADRLEADVFQVEGVPSRSLGLALIRDCNGARSLDTLLRYRSGTLAELWRALRTLQALQAEQAARAEPAAAPRRIVAAPAAPIEPEYREHAGVSGRPAHRADRAQADPPPAPSRLSHLSPATAGDPASSAQPIEPKRRGQPVKAALPSLPTGFAEQSGSAASLLGGTALVALGRRP